MATYTMSATVTDTLATIGVTAEELTEAFRTSKWSTDVTVYSDGTLDARSAATRDALATATDWVEAHGARAITRTTKRGETVAYGPTALVTPGATVVIDGIERTIESVGAEFRAAEGMMRYGYLAEAPAVEQVEAEEAPAPAAEAPAAPAAPVVGTLAGEGECEACGRRSRSGRLQWARDMSGLPYRGCRECAHSGLASIA